MRVFVDVGAHEGQTVAEVLRHDFDVIHALEPMPAQFAALSTRYRNEARVRLHDVGLSDRTEWASIYGDNANLGASLFADKNDVDSAVVTRCRMVRATEFFAALVPLAATVIVKLNCEGAEVPILDDLAAGTELDKVTAMLVDFDVRKVPGMEHHEQRVLARLADVGFDRYRLAEEVMVGATHAERIRAWLTGIGC